ncbi:MAG: type II toxin-antitoxin system ParD family antitoxin [Gracilimonas sp.]|nr:type II toxin-antitoxin system ParD family antitoxin [Gracilimonas sp.]
MHISLTPEIEKLTKEKVESGMYGNASEVVRDAIHQMHKYDSLFYELKKEQFIKLIEEGEKSGISKLSITDIINE